MIDENIKSFKLNRFVVEKVNLDKRCICNYHNYNDDFSICNGCPFISNSKTSCEFKEVEIEIATGRHIVGESSHNDWKYIHWCCPMCGELLKVDDYCSWADETFRSNLHTCNSCKTPQKYLRDVVDVSGRDVDHKYIFAVPTNTHKESLQ